MYAIVRTGGKQYKVEAGRSFKVEKIEQPVGTEIELTDVLFIGGEKVLVGVPSVENAAVTVVVSKQAKAPKIIVLKKKRRQGYRKLQGHRQSFTELFVMSIEAPGVSAKADKEPKLYTDELKAKVKEEKAATVSAKKAETKTSAKKPAKKKVAKKAAVKKPAAKKSATKKKATKKKVTKAVTKKKATKKKSKAK
jgi:large subunit ribosomal protein L21